MSASPKPNAGTCLIISFFINIVKSIASYFCANGVSYLLVNYHVSWRHWEAHPWAKTLHQIHDGRLITIYRLCLMFHIWEYHMYIKISSRNVSCVYTVGHPGAQPISNWPSCYYKYLLFCLLLIRYTNLPDIHHDIRWYWGTHSCGKQM